MVDQISRGTYDESTRDYSNAVVLSLCISLWRRDADAILSHAVRSCREMPGHGTELPYMHTWPAPPRALQFAGCCLTSCVPSRGRSPTWCSATAC